MKVTQKAMQKIFQKIIVLLFFTMVTLILVNNSLYAEEKKDSKDKTNYQQHKKEISTTKQKTKIRSPNFIPSEKINADSSVSFPVDI